MHKREGSDRGHQQGKELQNIILGNKSPSKLINLSPHCLGGNTAYPTPEKIPTTYDLGPGEIDTSQFRDCFLVYGKNCIICRKGEF